MIYFLKDGEGGILLFIENLAAHPLNVKLNSIQLFFSSNFTSVLQSLDQDISFKVHYRKEFI
ncbi:hypothetical protein X975_20541, partial [Stegodyphus mimosarum]